MYPNPDVVLSRQGSGQGLVLYEQILRDPHIYSNYQQRWLAVTGKERQVLPGADTPAAKKAAEFVESVVNAIPLFDQVLFQLLHGIHYGFRCAEIMWEVSEGDVWVQKIIARQPKYFSFDIHGNPRLLTITSPLMGEELPERKIQRFIYPGGDDNPYGQGLGQRLYWWDWFKRNNVKFWVLFNEKFGSPTAVGKYPNGSERGIKDKLLEVLAAIQQESGIIIPEGQEVSLLEAARTSSTSTYKELCDYCDSQASKCIVGQTLTTQVGATGSYAASQTHMEVKDEIIEADADLLCFYLNNELLRWICDFNIPGLKRDEYPQMWIKCEEGDDLNTLIDRDKKIAASIDVPARYFYETYDIPEPVDGEPLARGESVNRLMGESVPAQFAEISLPPSSLSLTAAQQELDAARENIPDAALQAQMETVLKPVLELINQGESFEKIMAQLAAANPLMDTKQLEEIMARAMFVSDVWGRLNA